MKKTLRFITITSLMVITMLSGCMTASTLIFPAEENHVEVFEDIDGTKDQIYLKANNWMIETFNDAESVIQHNDKQEGVIIGKYKMFGTTQTSPYGTADSRVYAIIDIRVKDNKARIEIKPQSKWYYDASGMSIYSYSKQDALKDMQKLAESFHQSIQKAHVEF
jgi:hypothetical protein